jgi:hypothetical protein
MKRAILAISALGALTMGLIMVLASGTAIGCCVYGTPPVITAVNANPDTLWPPNHKMVEITLDVQGTDFDDWYISGVTPQNLGSGEGPPTNDPDYYFNYQYLELRAERSGKAGGRVYLIYVTATNDYGTDTSWVSVTVPHDMRGN